MNNIIEAIDKEASTLPPEFQREVLGLFTHKERTQIRSGMAGAGLGRCT